MSRPPKNAHSVTMLGTGLIGTFYTMTLHGQRNRDRVGSIYSRSEERAGEFARAWKIPHWTTDLLEAIEHPGTDTVVIGLPNDQHEEAVRLAAEAGKAILSTKPLAREAAEAKRILDLVESHGVFHGYLEDLCYTPKTLKAVASVRDGAIGDVMWVRSRETHPGPHSAWFWDAAQAGGGPIVDLGCHCIEIIRSFVGKGNRPIEVMCHADTLVHPIEAEDNAIALIKFESGGIGQYVAEKAETASGWLFPVGDEVSELGYVDMFTDMFDAMEQGCEPRETFYDGYVVNAIVDACYRSARSRRWEPVEVEWRGGTTPRIAREPRTHDGHVVIKEEKLPDGRTKLI